MLFLWTGPKHGGKTTAAAQLVQTARQHGCQVAGFLAPSVYRDGRLVGFDILDLRSGVRTPLAVRRGEPGDIGQFHFFEEAWGLGRQALDPTATAGADLVIVDEFGPLELASHGWRAAVDSLIESGRPSLLLVVRQGLVESVRQLYAAVPGRVLDATAPVSIHAVLRWLRKDDPT